jgi:hypothetical protein
MKKLSVSRRLSRARRLVAAGLGVGGLAQAAQAVQSISAASRPEYDGQQ